MSANIVLLETGHTFPALAERVGGFPEWFAAPLKGLVDHWTVVDGTVAPPSMTPGGVDGVIVTGSPASVHERAPWSEASGRWLAAAARAGIPIFGICYGHQLLGDALGGEAGPAPAGREIGACGIDRDVEDPIFEGLAEHFLVWQTHSDELIQLPPDGYGIASNTHGTYQAFGWGERCRGVQWHPEMSPEIMRFYINERRALIDAERGEGAADLLIETLPKSQLESGPRILQNFARCFLELGPRWV
ncbi:MAG: gamma-glutamyl-gamma-aminobutyrate hydrolase family protein [Myxococcota bacterium]|nr:gamma-glutamyl-gamma-aminobutyrate hydrolase family protein [Myxococcota bacterium]